MSREDEVMYRVVLDGTGRRSGSLEGPLQRLGDATEGLATVEEVFARDIADGDMAASVMTDAEWQERNRP